MNLPEHRRLHCPHCGASVVVEVKATVTHCLSCLRPFACPPWSPEQSEAAAQWGRAVDHPPDVLALLGALEEHCQAAPASVVQRALAAALWRITNRERLTARDERHEVVALTLRDGGRVISLEVLPLPGGAKVTPEERQRHGQLRAIARVRLVVEYASGPWDGSASFTEIHQQAQWEAIEKLPRELLARGYRVVGSATVTGVELRSWPSGDELEESLE